jgi:hypothetical protein
MATILDRYGIKEVADVTFYEIKDGKPGAPVLYLDTLKVSTIEQTAENAEARGGKGNAALISWDYGKEITVTLEDALYSPKSLALMFGDTDSTEIVTTGTTKTEIRKTFRKDILPSTVKPTTKEIDVEIDGHTFNLSSCSYYDDKGNAVTTDGGTFSYVTGIVNTTETITIDVSANTFPGTYYVTGDTYARSETDGTDSLFQFIIPKAKVLSESNTITLEAEGDPTVFSMSLKVLRPADGKMMKLVQYALGPATTQN